MHKSKFFETFLNNLQRVSIEYRKRTKKVGISRVKSIFFQKGFFYIEGFHFYKVNIHFFCIFLDFFSKYFLLKLKLFRHNSYYNKNLLKYFPKIGKKVGIHFYENILSEINLPLILHWITDHLICSKRVMIDECMRTSLCRHKNKNLCAVNLQTT